MGTTTGPAGPRRSDPGLGLLALLASRARDPSQKCWRVGRLPAATSYPPPLPTPAVCVVSGRGTRPPRRPDPRRMPSTWYRRTLAIGCPRIGMALRASHRTAWCRRSPPAPPCAATACPGDLPPGRGHNHSLIPHFLPTHSLLLLYASSEADPAPSSPAPTR